MNANIFREDLAFSDGQHAADWWDAYYQRAFPTLTSIQKVPGPSAAQRAGVDKFVMLRGGKRIAVDEKIRRDRKPIDLCLEIEHVPIDGKSSWPGWITKPNQFTDFLAMGFAAYRIAFFFPFPTLQCAWHKYGPNWVARYGVIKAPNPREQPRYHTHSVCVPTEVLMASILDSIRVQL